MCGLQTHFVNVILLRFTFHQVSDVNQCESYLLISLLINYHVSIIKRPSLVASTYETVFVLIQFPLCIRYFASAFSGYILNQSKNDNATRPRSATKKIQRYNEDDDWQHFSVFMWLDVTYSVIFNILGVRVAGNRPDVLFYVVFLFISWRLLSRVILPVKRSSRRSIKALTPLKQQIS